jgi:ankyrin repeat protein
MDFGNLASSATHRDLNRQLIAASAMGNITEVKKLLRQDAFINSVDASGDTPLMLAAHFGHFEIVKFLLNCKDITVNGQQIQGIRVNLVNKTRETALMFAAKSGHFTIVDVLLEAGAETNYKDAFGKTALILALENNHHKIVCRLQQACHDFSDQMMMQPSMRQEIKPEFILPLFLSTLERVLSETATFPGFNRALSNGSPKAKPGCN